MPTEAPTIATSLERLETLVDQAWANGEPAVFPLLDGTPLRGMSIYAHVDHAVRLSRAVSAMSGLQMYVELVPLIRLTLECAVTAAWYSVTAHAGDSALLEASRLRRALLQAISDATQSPVDKELESINRDIAELDEFKSREASKFESRCLALAGGRWLYVIYRELSGFSHAGALLLDHYIQEAPDEPLGFAYVRDQDEQRARSDLGTQVYLLHIALSAWQLVVPDELRGATLARIEGEAGFQSGIARSEE